VSGPAGDRPTAAIAAPRSRVIPAALLVLGIAICVYAALLRDDLRTESVTVKGSPPVRSVVEKAPSDTLVLGLFGAGLASVLLGAFYARVTKITLGANTIELAALADSDTLANAAAAKVLEEQRAAGVPLDARAAGAVTRSAAVAARAQSEALLLRAAAPATAADPGAESRGAALPPALLDRLIDRAAAETRGPEPPSR
jgi:hypothetical protein